MWEHLCWLEVAHALDMHNISSLLSYRRLLLCSNLDCKNNVGQIRSYCIC